MLWGRRAMRVRGTVGPGGVMGIHRAWSCCGAGGPMGLCVVRVLTGMLGTHRALRGPERAVRGPIESSEESIGLLGAHIGQLGGTYRAVRGSIGQLRAHMGQ